MYGIAGMCIKIYLLWKEIVYLDKKHSVLFIPFLFIALVFSHHIHAKDIIKLNKGRSTQDIRSDYNIDLLHKALKITEPEFGEYEIKVVSRGIPSIRIRQMITEGSIVNVAMVVSTPEWEEAATPIRIPLRLGILNYRLLLINKNKASEFANIKTLEQLKNKIVGLERHWATWQTMSDLGFSVVSAYSYEAIFSMLDKSRFDYIPRGMHEIYDEINIRKGKLNNLMVEPNLALYIPAPFYVFISPNEPRLIKRFELGISRLAQQGILKEKLNQHYSNFIKRANLKSRLILDVSNLDLLPNTPVEDKELWFNWEK